MQDEVNEKTVALSFRAARLTKDTLMKAIQMYLRHRKGTKMRGVVQKHGKISVKELVGQGQGASSIEVGKDDIKDFERIARRYDVDFAVKKDKTMDPPKYVVFFKGKDQDVISQAFKEFVSRNEKKRERPSLKAKLAQYVKKAMSMDKNRERTKDKHKDRGQSL